MKIKDIRWVFEQGIGNEFRVTYYQYGQLRRPPQTQVFTLVDDHPQGVFLQTEYNKIIFLPFERIEEVTKIL